MKKPMPTEQTIQSNRHPLVLEVSALSRKKERDEQKRILVETKHPIEEAIKAGLSLEYYFVLSDAAESMLPVMANAVQQYTVSEAVMKKLATTESIPPCLAVFKYEALSLEQFLINQKQRHQSSTPCYLFVDQMQDPGNLGTLIRTAAAFNVDAIILSANAVDPMSPKVIRSSAGLVFSCPVIQGQMSLEGCIELEALATSQWLFTTGHPEWQGQVTQSYRAINYQQPTVLVLGNEGQGVSDINSFPKNSFGITVPTNPQVESLNVSISAAIILAEAYYQKQNQVLNKI